MENKEKIMIDKKDFEFIDSFCDRFKLSEGKGTKILLSIFLNNYKISVIKEASKTVKEMSDKEYQDLMREVKSQE